MLCTLTADNLQHLHFELFAAKAKRAQRHGHQKAKQQAQDVAATLFVVNLGVDVACPR
jgi:hypothetical protein